MLDRCGGFHTKHFLFESKLYLKAKLRSYFDNRKYPSIISIESHNTFEVPMNHIHSTVVPVNYNIVC